MDFLYIQRKHFSSHSHSLNTSSSYVILTTKPFHCSSSHNSTHRDIIGHMSPNIQVHTTEATEPKLQSKPGLKSSRLAHHYNTEYTSQTSFMESQDGGAQLIPSAHVRIRIRGRNSKSYNSS